MNPEAISLAPIWSGIKKFANVPVRPAVNTQNINMVPCIVTNAKYIFGSKTPPGAHFSPKNHSNTAKDSPGFDSCSLKRIDINIPTVPINIPVIRNCFAIIL